MSPPDAADALYDLPPEEFVAARNALAKELRAAGDKHAAAVVAKLRRPTATAYALNHVARRQPDVLAAALDARDALREATVAGGDVREARQTADKAATRAVVDAAQGVLGAADATLAQRVTATLLAAVVDADVAADLRAGRLAAEQTSPGFGFSVEDADIIPFRSIPGARDAAAGGGGGGGAGPAQGRGGPPQGRRPARGEGQAPGRAGRGGRAGRPGGPERVGRRGGRARGRDRGRALGGGRPRGESGARLVDQRDGLGQLLPGQRQADGGLQHELPVALAVGPHGDGGAVGGQAPSLALPQRGAPAHRAVPFDDREGLVRPLHARSGSRRGAAGG